MRVKSRVSVSLELETPAEISDFILLMHRIDHKKTSMPQESLASKIRFALENIKPEK